MEKLKKIERNFKLIKQWFYYNILTINNNKINYRPFSSHRYHLPDLEPLNISMDLFGDISAD